MNRHTRLAIIVAPFLAIGGYVASDYYVRYKNSAQLPDTQPLYKLSVTGNCDLANNRCELTAGDLILRLSDSQGTTRVVSNYPLDRVTISVVNERSGESVYRMGVENDRQHWRVARDTSNDRAGSPSPLTLRISAAVGSAYYISEFKAVLQTSDQSAAN